MSLRIRTTGEIVCAAMHPELPGDIYIHDGASYELTVARKLIVTEPMHCDGGMGGHAKHGLWWWRNAVPAGVQIDPFALDRGRWDGEICKRCLRRNCVGFDLPDDVWNAVVRDRWTTLCTSCFDEEAETAGVAYSFGEVWPVSWSDWSRLDEAPARDDEREPPSSSANDLLGLRAGAAIVLALALVAEFATGRLGAAGVVVGRGPVGAVRTPVPSVFALLPSVLHEAPPSNPSAYPIHEDPGTVHVSGQRKGARS